MIRRGLILVPTDFSDLAREALRRAVRIAERFPARVRLFHAAPPPAPAAWGFEFEAAPPPIEWLEEMRQAARRRIEEQAAAFADAGVEIETEIVEDAADPAEAICEAARRLEADLIVIGRHGRRGLIERFLLGATAERVVRHAPCSVLVAMPHGFFGRDDDAPTDDAES